MTRSPPRLLHSSLVNKGRVLLNRSEANSTNSRDNQCNLQQKAGCRCPTDRNCRRTHSWLRAARNWCQRDRERRPRHGWRPCRRSRCLGCMDHTHRRPRQQHTSRACTHRTSRMSWLLSCCLPNQQGTPDTSHCSQQLLLCCTFRRRTQRTWSCPRPSCTIQRCTQCSFLRSLP